MTPDEWLEKADWEGGVYGGFDYGLNASDVDENYPVFRELVREAGEIYEDMDHLIQAMLDYNVEDEASE